MFTAQRLLRRFVGQGQGRKAAQGTGEGSWPGSECLQGEHSVPRGCGVRDCRVLADTARSCRPTPTYAFFSRPSHTVANLCISPPDHPRNRLEAPFANQVESLDQERFVSAPLTRRAPSLTLLPHPRLYDEGRDQRSHGGQVEGEGGQAQDSRRGGGRWRIRPALGLGG